MTTTTGKVAKKIFMFLGQTRGCQEDEQDGRRV